MQAQIFPQVNWLAVRSGQSEGLRSCIAELRLHCHLFQAICMCDGYLHLYE